MTQSEGVTEERLTYADGEIKGLILCMMTMWNYVRMGRRVLCFHRRRERKARGVQMQDAPRHAEAKHK